MWNPQTTDFSTWVKNEFKHLAEKHREKPALWVDITIHECKNEMPGEIIGRWQGKING